MKTLIIALALFASLSACGADGAPEAPATKAAAASGLTVSGCAKIGMVFGGSVTDKSDC